MITVTDNAATVLAQSLKESRNEEGQTLRLIQNPEGYSLELGHPETSDEVVEHQGETVLAVSQEVGGALGDITVDIEAREDGAHLVLRQGG